jgi:hypothetical protein
MKTNPKFIKKGNCYLVVEINTKLKPTEKGYQKFNWFSTLKEAINFKNSD